MEERYERRPVIDDPVEGSCEQCGRPCIECGFHAGVHGWRLGSPCCEARVIPADEDE